jgi:hypothetical protein
VVFGYFEKELVEGKHLEGKMGLFLDGQHEVIFGYFEGNMR